MRDEKQPDKCAPGNFFGRTEKQLAKNLTVFFQVRNWVLYQLKPAKSDRRLFSVLLVRKAYKQAGAIPDTIESS